jgi:hypothetical protein
MKGDAANILPAYVAAALLAALKAVPPRKLAGGWPIIDEERGGWMCSTIRVGVS